MTPERYEELVARGQRTPDGCLIWPGATGGDGKVMYGVAKINGKLRTIHRAVWQLFHPDEELPPGRPPRGTPRIVVTHSCHHSLCYEHTHLVLKSQQENLLERPDVNHRAWGQTHCKHGHSLADAYIHPASSGGQRRNCRTCAKARSAAQHQSRKSTREET